MTWIAVAVIRALVILVVTALLPQRALGRLIISSGIAIWAVELRRARRLLAYARARVGRWRRWYRGQVWPIKILVGLLTTEVVLCGAVGRPPPEPRA